MPDPRGSRAERTPRFETVSAALKREIAAGRFSESDVLPGERELSGMLNVSRTTLRRAIGGLIDEGVLAHRHGAGTFVRRNPPHVEQPLSRLTSFTEDMRLRGLAATSRVIEQGAFLPTPEEVMMLGIGPGESVYRLARLRLADGVPMAIDRAAAPLHFVERAQGMEHSLYAALEGAGFRPVRALQRLRAIIIGPAEAALLEVAEGSAALDIQRIAYLPDHGRCGNRVHSSPSIAPTRFDFVAELTLSPSSRQRTEEGAARGEPDVHGRGSPHTGGRRGRAPPIGSTNAASTAELAANLRAEAQAIVRRHGRSGAVPHHAALYLKQLVELKLALALRSGPRSPSLYHAPLWLRAQSRSPSSQSGQSPDIVAMQRTAKDQRAMTIAFVNDEASPLAREWRLRGAAGLAAPAKSVRWRRPNR